MLPTPAELRELSERIREAVPKALTDEMKRLLFRDALRLAEAADQVERDSATLGAYVHRANVERYEYLLERITDERARRTIETLLAEENASIGKRRSEVKAWRMRAEELRATAEQFGDPSAQASMRRAAENLDKMASHAEELMTGKPKAPGEKAG